MEAVKSQTVTDFQWVIVDDGSSVDFNWKLLDGIGVAYKLIHKEHEERVIGYNRAFEAATGEWFVLLDSDDEIKPNTLEVLSKAIKKYPKVKMFNFGCIFQHKDGNMTYRDPFTPKRKKVGHERFGGGNIVNGTFTFHRSIYEDLGAYPDGYIKNIDCSALNYKDASGSTTRDLFMGSPYDFSAAAQLQFPEIQDQFLVDHENEPTKIIKELGNPWGQDFYLFYKLTRKYHSKVLREYLYIVHPR
jgi:glycosyltransferase involved in cell wall biosynthesis